MLRPVTVRQRKRFKGPRPRSKRLYGEKLFKLFLELLRSYSRTHGHARVPKAHREGNFQLGVWVNNARRAHLRGELSPERARIFEAFPGWSWRPREERFRRGLHLLRRFAGQHGHALVPYDHAVGDFRLGNWVQAQRGKHSKAQLSKERVRLLEGVRGWSWDARAESFFSRLVLLRRFVRREGHARVPPKHVQKGVRLGSWALTLRQEYKQGKLSRERIRILERFPGWTWDPFEERFRRALRLLRQFARGEGHACVPQDTREDGFGLGAWVAARRRDHHAGRLSRERERLIEALPGWTWTPLEDKFERGLRALRAYVRREKHARVPQHCVQKGFRLGQWVQVRRLDYRAGRLSTAQRRLLEALPGWSCDPRRDDFRRGLDLLRRFARHEGHTNVPNVAREAGFRLGQWVEVRRRQYRSGKLAKEHIRVLEALPGWSWDPIGDRFRRALRLLREFARREGHACPPSQTVEDGFPLGTWAERRRGDYRAGRLSKEHTALLEGVPGWRWDILRPGAGETRGRKRAT